MTMTSSSSHENPTTSSSHIIEQQPAPPSPPPAPSSVYNSSNFIRQNAMDPHHPSAVQISWSPSMLTSEHPNVATFLSSSSNSPQAATTTAPTRSSKSLTSRKAENSHSSAPNTIGRTFSRHQTLFGQQEQDSRNENMLGFLPLSNSSVNAHGNTTNRNNTADSTASVHNYEGSFDVVPYPSTLSDGSPSSAPAPWEQPSVTPPTRSIIRSSDNNQHNISSFYMNRRHDGNNGNNPNPSPTGAGPSTMYTNYRSNNSRDQQPQHQTQPQHQHQHQSSMSTPPWLQPSMWSSNTSNDNVSSYSTQQPQLLSENHRSSQNDITQDNFSLEFLDSPIPNLLPSKKHASSFSMHPARSASSWYDSLSSTDHHHHQPQPPVSAVSFRPLSKDTTYHREKKDGTAFDDATASATTALFQQSFLSKTSSTSTALTEPTASAVVSKASTSASAPARATAHSNISSLSTTFVEPSTARLGLGTARYLQDAAVASWLRPQLQSYLLSPDPIAMGERTVVILTGKVAQKSYGTEKRFLCPPPTVIFDGISWWTNATPPKLEVSMSGEASEVQEGQLDWFSTSGTIVGQTGFRNNYSTGNSNRLKNADKSAIRDWCRIPQHDPLAGGKCVLRQLYINDADEKRKRVECLARIQLADSSFTGTVSSKPIKVISKPSKKRSNVKNTDACIHHGSTVSLFNRIRSQTVSTKYLGVSSSSSQQPFMYPGQSNKPGESNGRTTATLPTTSSSDGTCFIARTGSWDPFAIWLVDRNWEKKRPDEHVDVDEYIGPSCAQALRNDVPYPPPPAIAAKNKTGQPLPIHYNQHIVLQCLTTGLVSPIMIIRKVDRAATVVGGANIKFYPQPSEEPHHHQQAAAAAAAATTPDGAPCGGEYGDEILGDPVSQLHKVALQIVQDPATSPPPPEQQQQKNQNNMLPYTGKQPITYLACLNDMVGTHRSVHERKSLRAIVENDETHPRSLARRRIASTSSAPDFYYSSKHPSPSHSSILEDQPYQHHNHHHHNQPLPPPLLYSTSSSTSKRGRSMSVAEGYYGDNQSLQTTITPSWSDLGAYWYEDVSDSAVWSIVGTDYSKYTLWEPSVMEEELGDVQYQPQANHMIPSLLSYSQSKTPSDANDDQAVFLSIHGEYFSRELNVWFGDIRSTRSEYRSRELIICQVPTHAELTHAVGAQWKNDGSCTVPILLVRNDGKAVYKTNKYYSFC